MREIFFAMQSLCLHALRCGVRWQSAEDSARCPIRVDCDGFVYHYGIVFIEYVSELLVAVIVFCAIHIYIAYTIYKTYMKDYTVVRTSQMTNTENKSNEKRFIYL